ncbi:MAG: hypothetical protein U0Q16_21975 [Bryobacteraceae bacterium]
MLKERNGVDVQLTGFVAGGYDYGKNIGAWFGSTRLPGNGTLTAGLCWQLDRVPVTLQYRMEGTDRSGKKVQATLSVDFKSLDEKSGDELQSGVSRAGALAHAAAGNSAPTERFRKPSRPQVDRMYR